MKRTVVISAKLTADEAEKIRHFASSKGMTVSEFVRSVLLGLKIPSRFSPERVAKRNEVFRSFLREINRIGVNINQIARHCNYYREVDALVLEQLMQANRELKELVRKLYEEFK